MRPQSVVVTLNGAQLPLTALTWAPDKRSATVAIPGIQPYLPFTLAAGARAVTAAGDPLSGAASVKLSPVATIPANSGSGIDAGFQPKTPVAVVIENSGPARPQSGLQDADVVYEYVSEYAITRMTALFFKNIPSTVGPVRSCRLINTYLGYAYDAVTMCSGVSGGTSVWIHGNAPDARPVPAIINGEDPGNHFHRVANRPAPYNLYLSGGDASRVRSEKPQPPGQYAVDPPHPDVAAGDPAPAPQVPLHSVAYAYDDGAKVYARSDHGGPFVDANKGAPLHVKNVVLLHVDFHDAGYVEDEVGGAHSISYTMVGSGPAEVYSNGQVVQATWLMGAPGQHYYDNHTPVWFTDAKGDVLTLNTGLTWIHVLGNGQTS
jgi:hypothetical protein